MQINMSELFSTVGMSKTRKVPFEMKTVSVNGISYPVSEASQIELTMIHSGNGVMQVSGNVDLQLDIPCDRCLKPVSVPISLTLEQEIDTNASEEERMEALDEQPFVQGYMLDVDLLVYDELLVNMPVKVLCRPDCRGVCPKCGADLNQGSCGCDMEDLDPRMSVIRDIFKNSMGS